MKSLPWILAGAALVVIVGVWQLLAEDEAVTDAGVVIGGPPLTRAAEADSEQPSSAPVVPSREARPLDVLGVEPVTADVEEGPPESYRRALGGFIGRVLEASGEPVAGLRLDLVGGGLTTLPFALDAALDPDKLDFEPVLGNATTDEEGRFAISEVNPRILGVLVIDPGGPRSMLHMLEETPISGTVRDLGDIILPASVTFVGFVTDERDVPLPGVRVRATDLPSIAVGSGIADYRQGGAFLIDTPVDDIGKFTYKPPTGIARLERLLPVPTTVTDDEGAFELPGVRPGIVTVLADDGMHMTHVGQPVPSGEAGSTHDVGTIVMGDGVTLEGVVVDESDKPVAGAEVMAGNTMQLGAPITILRAPVMADEKGRFEVRGLAPRGAHAVARADGHDIFVASEEATPGFDEARVVLRGLRQLVLRLVDEENVPIAAPAGVRFLGRCVPDDDIDDMPDFFMRPRPLDSNLTVDEDQRYVFSDLDAGLWDVMVSVPGYATMRAAYDLTWEDLEESIVLSVGMGMPVRVVRGADGEPVEHALVAVFSEEYNDRPLTMVRTNVQGQVVIPDLLEGNYAVKVAHPALAVGVAEGTVPSEEEVLVELFGGGTIAGSVVDNGSPPVNTLMVTLEPGGDGPEADQMPRMTLTAPDGSFEFRDVPPGEVGLAARERFDLTNLMTWWEPLAMTPLAEDKVMVETDKEVEAVLIVGNTYDGIETGFVEGRLIVNGMPGADWKVRTWGQIRRSVTTGPDGRFNMGRLAVGDVVLMFAPASASMMSGGAVETHQFELKEGDREFIDLVITTGAVRGRVINDLDGRPIEGAIVALSSSDQKPGRWGGRRSGTVTDRNGDFEITPVVEGDYVVSAEAEGLAQVRSDTFNVSGMRPTDGVVLRLFPAITFAGVVVIEGADRNPAWMWLTAEEEDGTEAACRPDTDDLTFTFDDLSPGTWTFTLHCDLGLELDTITKTIVRSEEGEVLHFVPPEEVEEEEEPKNPDGEESLDDR